MVILNKKGSIIPYLVWIVIGIIIGVWFSIAYLCK